MTSSSSIIIQTAISIYTRFFPLFLLLCFSYTATGETSYDFQTLTTRANLKLLGDAHIYNNTIRLTGYLTVPNSGAGRVLFNKPIPFRRTGNPNPTSFATHFSFSILDLNPNSVGGGFAFVISPDDISIGAAGGFLGIPAGSVAVEFDTVKDVDFTDVDGNHVALDINSMVSLQAVNLDSVNINLRSGEIIHSWVEYSGSNHKFKVYISHSKTKPKTPVLSVTIDLSQYVNESMYVGFSGSTQGSTEIHSIRERIYVCRVFRIFASAFDDPDTELGPSSPPPPKSPLNPMPTSMMPTAISTTNTTQKNPSQGQQIIALVCAFISILLAGGIGITIYFKHGKGDERRYWNICNWCSNVNN